jgi:serine/threonine protein kinase
MGKDKRYLVVVGVYIYLVACKKLKSEQLQEFEQESLILSVLRHPNIVQYFGLYLSDDKQAYMVMEFCELGSLDSFARANELTAAQMISWYDF